MQSTMMILTTFFAAGALASPLPLAPREQMCNKAPNGPRSGDFAPFSQPHAITADLCHQQCQADQNCLSFVYGFNPSAQNPECMFFHIPGSQVPGQENNLHVFDKDCFDVPTGKSTKQDPMGEQRPSPCPSPAKQGPVKNDGPVKDNGPAKATTTLSPPAATHAPSPQNGAHHQRDVANKCGGAPTGPAGNAPPPMRTNNDVVSEKDCLSLCKETDGCKAVEFGKPSGQAVHECRLFSVEAGQLPAPDHDQSFTAFDSRC